VPNKPSAANAGGFRREAFTKPANSKGKENLKQVKPALRLPAGRYQQGEEKTATTKMTEIMV
jgi:hypothetical protein